MALPPAEDLGERPMETEWAADAMAAALPLIGVTQPAEVCIHAL